MQPLLQIDKSQLFFVQPETAEELSQVAPDIEQVHEEAGTPGYVPGYVDTYHEHPTAFTVVYHHDRPIAVMEIHDKDSCTDIELGDKSLSFGGAVIPEYRPYGITLECAPPVIKRAFKLNSKKEKMLAKVDHDNRVAQIALAHLGFRKISGKAPKPLVYMLTRKELK